MTYIDYLNNFNRWVERHAMPPTAQLLYYKLLGLFNCYGWPEQIRVDNNRMMSMIGTSAIATLTRARSELVDAGFLQYKSGRKGIPCSYTLTEKNKNENLNENVCENLNENVNEKHNKTKDKRTKTNKYIDDSGNFDTFWQAYPRKVSKPEAYKAFMKIKNVPIETLLKAIEKQKQSRQWQTVEYIPHPATWLNQRRWEDEETILPGQIPIETTPLLTEEEFNARWEEANMTEAG